MATFLKVYEVSDVTYYIAWCCDGCEGCALEEAWEKEAPENWEVLPLSSMTLDLRDKLEQAYAFRYVRSSRVRYNVEPKGVRKTLWFDTKEEAQYALRAAKDGVKAAREEFAEVKKAKKENKKHEPSWMAPARAAGWTPPKKAMEK